MLLSRNQFSRRLYLFGMLILVASLPSSPYFTSIGQWIMALGWVIDNPHQKLKKLVSDKSVLFFLILYCLHVISLLWSNNFEYAFHDLKIKLPLLILPILIATSEPLNKKELKLVFGVFIAAIFSVSVYGIAKNLLLTSGTLSDHRKLSPFISHIRFALMQNFVLVLLWFIIWDQQLVKEKWIKVLVFTLAIILIMMIVVMKTLSGVVVLACLFGLFVFHLLRQLKSIVFKWTILVFSVSFMFLAVNYFAKSYARYKYQHPYNFSDLPKTTINGNPYTHDTLNLSWENGHPVNLFICESELQSEWNKRSSIYYDSLITKDSEKINRLITFLASKGLTKDSAGVAALTQKEIRAIENGFSSVIYLEEFSFYPRLHELFREIDLYKKERNPNGKSIIQRLYYLEAGWKIFRENLWFGVGVGDIKDAYSDYYERVQSPLIPEKRLRAHNQFLTFLVTFGIVGFIFIMFSQFAPIVQTSKKRKVSDLFLVFFFIGIVSMLNEDTLETQAGVTFYSFFYALLLWGIADNRDHNKLPETSIKT
ncbi:MAG TPA: O-antigen ligase family protein [Salinivirgaceae bacterium]|nr:O-antigen ligase family protein [Salinivirgaceae bacterium]